MQSSSNIKFVFLTVHMNIMTVKYVLLESCSIFNIEIVGINVVMGINSHNKLIDLFFPFC